MRLNPTVNFFKCIALALLMMASVVGYGDTNTKDTKKDETQKAKKEQVDENQKDSEQEAVTPENSEQVKEKKSAISNFSFNYLFYLIYKIKYADIFKLPSRNNNEDARSSSWSNVSLNKIYQKLTQPSL